MKITLIGDFSSLHLNLKKGFEALGHVCTLFSTGDGFKKIPGGIHYGPKKSGYIPKAMWLLKQPRWLDQVMQVSDIVQFMNPYSLLLPYKPGMWLYRRAIIKKLKAAKALHGTKLGLSLAGCSAFTIEQMSGMKRSPCPGCMNDTRTSCCVFNKPMNFDYEKELYEICDCIIPFGGCAYERSAKGLAALPMPIDHQVYPYRKNVVQKKIRILHGINREGFKGSRSIVNALNKITSNFKNVEIVIVKRLPFEEYLRVVASCNVNVDQLHCDGLGMNALLSMALGRVVLTSHDTSCIRKIYGESAPVLDISSEEDVYSTLAELAISWQGSDFIKAGEMSRQFVETRCDASTIASRVLEYYAKETLIYSSNASPAPSLAC